MTTGKALRKRNVNKLTSSSTASGEIEKQQQELAALERSEARMKKAADRVRQKLARERQRLVDAQNRDRGRKTAQTERAVAGARDRLETARHERDDILSEYRELKLLVRDQRSLVKSLEKKEAAKQQAVARFLKQWERDYDRKMLMKQRTIRKRRRSI